MTIRESMGIVRIGVAALGFLIGCSVDPIRTEMFFKAKSEVAIIVDYEEENLSSPESDIIRKRIASLVQAQLIERDFAFSISRLTLVRTSTGGAKFFPQGMFFMRDTSKDHSTIIRRIQSSIRPDG